MVMLLIVSLIGVCLYLVKRLNDASAENTVLRDQVASLKRQLGRQRNGARASAQ
jgi:flagellar biogenesis protein FliO